MDNTPSQTITFSGYRLVARREDVGAGNTCMEVTVRTDGAVLVAVDDGGGCDAPMAMFLPDGSSPRTRDALHALFAAMNADNLHAPNGGE